MDREMGIIARLQVQVTDQRGCHDGSPKTATWCNGEMGMPTSQGRCFPRMPEGSGPRAAICWVFFADFGEEIRQCPRCYTSVAKDYYALYHLEIAAAAFPELRFSFHVPHPIGKAFLPSPYALPRVEHTEQDGIFRFGRPLLADQKVLYREKVVEANLSLALAEAQRIWGPVGKSEETIKGAPSLAEGEAVENSLGSIMHEGGI